VWLHFFFLLLLAWSGFTKACEKIIHYVFISECPHQYKAQVKTVMDWLEWLTKYGFLEMIFGFGVLGLLAWLTHKIIPSNCD